MSLQKNAKENDDGKDAPCDSQRNITADGTEGRKKEVCGRQASRNKIGQVEEESVSDQQQRKLRR